jgi:Na+/melibiose symporter-like transporter
MHFTRARDLVTAGLVTAAVVYLLVRVLYRQLPPLPTFAGVTLFVLAVVETVLAFSIRSRIRNPREGRPLQALTAARAVALAKASSLLGAIMAGAWLGVLGYVLPRQAEITAAADDLPSTVVGVICSALLIPAALWLEWCCRTPRDQDNQPPERHSGSAG